MEVGPGSALGLSGMGSVSIRRQIIDDLRVPHPPAPDSRNCSVGTRPRVRC